MASVSTATASSPGDPPAKAVDLEGTQDDAAGPLLDRLAEPIDPAGTGVVVGVQDRAVLEEAGVADGMIRAVVPDDLASGIDGHEGASLPEHRLRLGLVGRPVVDDGEVEHW